MRMRLSARLRSDCDETAVCNRQLLVTTVAAVKKHRQSSQARSPHDPADDSEYSCKVVPVFAVCLYLGLVFNVGGSGGGRLAPWGKVSVTSMQRAASATYSVNLTVDLAGLSFQRLMNLRGQRVWRIHLQKHLHVECPLV